MTERNSIEQTIQKLYKLPSYTVTDLAHLINVSERFL